MVNQMTCERYDTIIERIFGSLLVSFKQDIANNLSIPKWLSSLASKEYFLQKRNNFHARFWLYNHDWTIKVHDLIGRTLPEVDELWKTDIWKDIYKLCYLYSETSLEIEFTRFFWGLDRLNNQWGKKYTEDLDIVLNFTKKIKSTQNSLNNIWIECWKDIDRKYLIQKIQAYCDWQKDPFIQIDGNWIIIFYDREQVETFMPFLKDIIKDTFNMIDKDEYEDLLFTLYQHFLADIMADTNNQEVQNYINTQDKQWFEDYVWHRYFS
jgi:hypothetical protein